MTLKQDVLILLQFQVWSHLTVTRAKSLGGRCYGVEYVISYQVLMTTHSC
mgnify:FL=1